MSEKQSAARYLAIAFLSGPLTLDDLLARGRDVCLLSNRWLTRLTSRVVLAFGEPSNLPAIDKLVQFIEADPSFKMARYRASARGRILTRPDWMPPEQNLLLQQLTTPGALAGWLGLKHAELDWFADCHGREAKVPSGPLRHYRYQWVQSRARKLRILEIPKTRLKAVQRRLLHEILGHIPPHAAAHGFRRGRSLCTYVEPHVGRRIVLRFDLRDFFPSIKAARVHALFRAAGYPAAVSRYLTGLCTNCVPHDVWQQAPPTGDARRLESMRPHYRFPHLPQGAPTSPALANLCAFRLDCRLAGLARALGASYTRYADDLAFSGDKRLERTCRRFQVHVCRIALEEGFEVNTRKTRFMRQQLAGVVLNRHANIGRSEYDKLKATLFNCLRSGPTTQNRSNHTDFCAHLRGRIGYLAMFNPVRAERLWALFERIQW
jgi:RNA-directed DNA polymerase